MRRCVAAYENLLESAKRLAAYWQRQRSKPFSLEDRNIRYLRLDTACQGLVMGGIFTFISVFVVRLGASSLLVSLLTSLPAIIMVLFSIPAGQIVERQRDLVRYTNRVRLLHRGSFLLVALLPFFVHDHLAEAIVFIWALKSVSSAFINSSWMAIVAEIIPPKRRPGVNGSRLALLSLVTAVAVAVFGYVLDRLAFPTGYQIVFVISFLGGVLSIYLFSLIKLPTDLPLQASPAKKVPPARRLRQYVRSFVETPTFLRFLFTTFVLRFGLNLPAALYSIYWIRHLNASDLWIGWQSTAGSLALIAGYFIWGRMATRKGHHLVLLACAAGMGFYPVLMGLVPAQVWLPLVALVRGFFVTGINLSFFDTLLHVCPPDRRPSFVALNMVFASLAVFLAPMAGSLLADWLDIRVVFFVSGGIHLLAILLFWLFRVAVEEADTCKDFGELSRAVSQTLKVWRIEHLTDHPTLIPTLARWHQEQWSYLDVGLSLEQRFARLQTHLGQKQIPTTFVALSGETLLGSASLIAHDVDTRMDLSPWLASVYVAAEHRRRGVGTALVGRVVQEAEALGVETLYLFTPDKEEFYARLGWSVVERTQYRGYRVAVMALQIGRET